MYNQTIDLESLVSRIEKIEEEQNLRNKNILWLKRYYEELRQDFDARPEVEYLENLQSAIAALSEQVSDLQQSLNQRLSSNGHSDDLVKYKSELAEHYADLFGIADVAEDEQYEKVDTAASHQQSVTFSDEKFKLLRMTHLLGVYGDMLLMEAYLVEEKSQDTPIGAEEFWKRYNEGERDFTGINLAEANLMGAVLYEMIDLSGANLSKANLKGANLRNAKLIGANLNQANLSQVTLIGANLKGANIQGADFQHGFYDETTIFPTGFEPTEAGVYLIAPGASLQNAFLAGSDLNHVSLSGANLQGANLNSTNLEGANLIAANLSGASLIGANLKSARLILANLKAANLNKANLSGARLSQVNLSEANISSVDLSRTFLWRANLQKANLKGANLVEADLSEAKLSGAIMPDGTTHK